MPPEDVDFPGLPMMRIRTQPQAAPAGGSDEPWKHLMRGSERGRACMEYGPLSQNSRSRSSPLRALRYCILII